MRSPFHRFSTLPVRLEITHQFIALFLVTSVLPIALIALFFYDTVDTRFRERAPNLLNMGLMVCNDAIRDGLSNLEFKVIQGANYPIRAAYHRYLKTGDEKQLVAVLKQYQVDSGVTLLRIYNRNNRIVAVSSTSSTHPPLSHKLLVPAWHGQVVSSLGRYRKPDDQFDLAYIAAAPIRDVDNPQRIIGVLTARYPMSESFSFQSILKVIPLLQIRIVGLDLHSRPHLLSYSSPQINQLPPEKIFHLLDHSGNLHSLQVSPMIREQIGLTHYRSIALNLKHHFGHLVGYVVLSRSEADLSTLKSTNLLAMEICLLLGLTGATMAAFFFKRTLIDPVDALADTSEKVTAGNITLRASEAQPQPKIHALMRNFNRMLDQIQEDDLLKRTFISTLTHDLRTPLYAQHRVLQTLLLSRGKQDTELGNILSELDRNNEHLLEMVSKILEAYQYEAGAIALHRERFDLGHLVEDCCASIRPLAIPKQIRLINNIPGDQFLIQADRLQLKRVFLNLLSNAIENIQEEKEVILSARRNGSFIETNVQDNGSGIGPDILPHIFQRYYTGHPTRQKIGSGLGLFICRMIVELHGGTIAVESQLGTGTHYTIQLPLLPEP